jgi:hypothetical protein
LRCRSTNRRRLGGRVSRWHLSDKLRWSTAVLLPLKSDTSPRRPLKDQSIHSTEFAFAVSFAVSFAVYCPCGSCTQWIPTGTLIIASVPVMYGESGIGIKPTVNCDSSNLNSTLVDVFLYNEAYTRLVDVEARPLDRPRVAQVGYRSADCPTFDATIFCPNARIGVTIQVVLRMLLSNRNACRLTCTLLVLNCGGKPHIFADL